MNFLYKISEKKTFNLSSKLSIADEVLNSKNFSMVK